MQHAHPVLHMLDPRPDDAAPWSAHHLPEPEAPRGLRFAVMAVAVGLVTVIMATSIQRPIATGGSQAEPPRFQASAERGQQTIQRGMTPGPSLQIASTAPAHR